MPSGAQLAILLLLGTAALTAVAFAVVRPPAPARMAGYRGPIAWLGRWAYWVTPPMLGAMRALGFTANGLTALGAAVNVAAGVVAGFGELGWAGFLLVFGSWCDLLDGEMARTTGTQTRAGAFLDSNLDRLSEMALFGGFAAALPGRAGVLWAVAALSGSMWVSYARARGEGLGVSCPNFGLERPHRVVLLMFALLAAAFLPAAQGATVVELTCALIAIGAGATALGRLVVIHQALRRAEGPGARAPAPAQASAAVRAPAAPAPGTAPRAPGAPPAGTA